MTDFTIKVRPDQGDKGTNEIELFLDTNPKREVMIPTNRGDSLDVMDEEDFRAEDEVLYYAVERIAQLEAQVARLVAAGDGMYEAFEALLPGIGGIALQDYSVINDNSIEWVKAKKEALDA